MSFTAEYIFLEKNVNDYIMMTKGILILRNFANSISFYYFSKKCKRLHKNFGHSKIAKNAQTILNIDV